MLHKYIRDDHAATYALTFQKKLTALRYHVQTSQTPVYTVAAYFTMHTHTHTGVHHYNAMLGM